MNITNIMHSKYYQNGSFDDNNNNSEFRIVLNATTYQRFTKSMLVLVFANINILS